jgi:hypothetical protein
MRRPSFQFYPADWRNNAKLRRCSEAARGAWMDILCVLHDSDEYGICRWPLADLARSAGVPLKLAKELADKEVLKGGDNGCAAFTYTTRHAGKEGPTYTLIPATDKPCWYSSRLVRDEWVRSRSGGETRFKPTKPVTTPPHGEPQGERQGGNDGERLGDGASSSTSSSTTLNPLPPSAKGEKKSKGPLQLRAEALMNRRPETPLTAKESRAFSKNRKAIEATTEEDWKALEAFYKAPQEQTFARKDLATLVNNWNGEIDRAKKWLAAPNAGDRKEKLGVLQRATIERQSLGKLSDWDEEQAGYKRIIELDEQIEKLRNELGVIA